MEEIKNYAYVALAAISLGGYIYTWLTGRSKANAAAISGLETRVKRNEERMARIDERMQDIPEIKDHIAQVHQRIDQVAETTSNLSGQMVQINNGLGVIQRALTKVP